MDSEGEREVLAELEELNLEEDEALKVYVVLTEGKKKTWAENKQFKLKMKKDRQHSDGTVGNDAPRHVSGSSDRKNKQKSGVSGWVLRN